MSVILVPQSTSYLTGSTQVLRTRRGDISSTRICMHRNSLSSITFSLGLFVDSIPSTFRMTLQIALPNKLARGNSGKACTDLYRRINVAQAQRKGLNR